MQSADDVCVRTRSSVHISNGKIAKVDFDVAIEGPNVLQMKGSVVMPG